MKGSFLWACVSQANPCLIYTPMYLPFMSLLYIEWHWLTPRSRCYLRRWLPKFAHCTAVFQLSRSRSHTHQRRSHQRDGGNDTTCHYREPHHKQSSPIRSNGICKQLAEHFLLLAGKRLWLEDFALIFFLSTAGWNTQSADVTGDGPWLGRDNSRWLQYCHITWKERANAIETWSAITFHCQGDVTRRSRAAITRCSFSRAALVMSLNTSLILAEHSKSNPAAVNMSLNEKSL